MSSSLVNALLVIGVLGFSVVAFMNRCTWFKWCDGTPGLFGGTLLGQGIGQGYGQIFTDSSTGAKTIIDPDRTVVGAPAAKVNSSASIPKKPKLQASGSASIGAGVGAVGKSNLALSLYGHRMSVF